MELAKRLNKIEPSPTLAISAIAAQMESEGKDLVAFGVGEPDFDTPEHIKTAAKKALDDGYTKYSPVPGYKSLRQAICDKLKRDNHVEFAPDQVIVGAGGKHVLYNLMMSLLNPGDEVIFTAPYWVSYKDLVVLAEGTPVIVETTADSGFKMSPGDLEKAITPKTRALLFNSPSNPTGAVYTEAELKALAEVLRKHPRVLIITDDIYEKLVYDGLAFFNIPMAAPDLSDRTVYVNGLSKAYAMTGWRLGYAAFRDKALIKAMDKLQGQSTSGVTSFSQIGGQVALQSGDACIAPMVKEFIHRRDVMMEALQKMPGVSVRKPSGAFYIFPDFSGLTGGKGFSELKKKFPQETSNSRLFCQQLLQEHLVAVVPGIAFGYDNGFRLSYATSMENIRKGMDRLGKFCQSLV